MRCISIIIAMMLFTLSLKAPSDTRAILIKQEPMQPFKPLIKAIGAVECNFDTLAYNPIEKATGYFQIRPIRIEDYNTRTGSNYDLVDMFDYGKAEIVFLYYASRIGPYNVEAISRNWNGGPNGMKIKATKKYFLKVQKVLLSLGLDSQE